MSKDTKRRVYNRRISQDAYDKLLDLEGVQPHFSQSGEDVVLHRIFYGKENGFYVDVGAFHPTRYSNTYLLHKLFGWQGLNIDASKHAVDLFNQARPNDTNIHSAVGMVEGEKLLYTFDHPARNTLSKNVVKRQESRGDTKLIGEEPVSVRRLSTLLDKHLPEGQQIDLLSIDIEGYDIQALESNDWTKYKPKVILIEDHSIKEGDIQKSVIYQYLTSKSYKFYSHTFDTSVYVQNDVAKSHQSIVSTRQLSYTEQKNAQISEISNQLNQTRRQLVQVKKQYNAITSSRSWRWLSGLRKLGVALREVRDHIITVAGKLKESRQPDALHILRNHNPPRVDALKASYEASDISNHDDSFVLYRIIGNDLHPRHKKGQSITNLKFILQNEKEFEGCEKRYIVNRIIDKDQEKQIIKLLDEYKQKYTVIPFSSKEYHRIPFDTSCLPEPGYLASRHFSELSLRDQRTIIAAVYRLKNNYIMNNNGARNVALNEGKTLAKWVLPWDGNCFLTQKAWKEIRRDVIKSPYFKYFAVPMARITDNNQLINNRKAPRAIEEPQLIFRKDTTEQFNEQYSYGRRPKVELFWRLGIPGSWDTWKIRSWDQPKRPLAEDAGQFGVAGWVARLFSGVGKLEEGSLSGFKDRGDARNEAIISTIQYVDSNLSKYSSKDTLYIDSKKLDSEAKEFQVGANKDLNKVVDNLLVGANEALKRKPYSVIDKTSLPPSGDRQDYWHPAPYWWPNPETLDGIPYIWKDGHRVPGTVMGDKDSDKYDRTRIQGVFDDSMILALAWKFSGKKEYARHGIKILERFFINPKTRMNPHLKYAQVRIGHNNDAGRAEGIIEMKDLYYYLDAIRLFQQSNLLDEEILNKFKAWLAEYLDWLIESPQGKQERSAANNHGTLYDLQVISIASFIDDKYKVYDGIIRAQSRISSQFNKDGLQLGELKRKTSHHYAFFNYYGWVLIAQAASKWGVDLWSSQTKDGARLIKGGEWLLSHRDKEWPYEQIDEFNMERYESLRSKIISYFGSDLISEKKPSNPLHHNPIYEHHSGVEPYWNLGL